MTIFVGTSGFNYDHWGDGVFYPEKLPQKLWLEHYVKYFNTVELNVTFYRLPSKNAFKSWQKRTPKNFKFVLKGSRFITHIKRLKNVKKSLKIFFEQNAPLRSKTRAVLWQLPPKMKCDLARLKDFVKLIKTYKKPYHVFEFRHESWVNDEVFSLLAKNKMSMCHADWPKFNMDLPDDFPFIYVRRHGPNGGSLYGACYTERQLKEDARKIKKWAKKKKDVFIYFNNDTAGYAVKNALRLRKLLK